MDYHTTYIGLHIHQCFSPSSCVSDPLWTIVSLKQFLLLLAVTLVSWLQKIHEHVVLLNSSPTMTGNPRKTCLQSWLTILLQIHWTTHHDPVSGHPLAQERVFTTVKPLLPKFTTMAIRMPECSSWVSHYVTLGSSVDPHTAQLG